MVGKYINRVRQKANIELAKFKRDLDCQDIVVFNLQKAIQSCIDIAAHVVADEGLGQPTGLADLFDLLGEHQIISSDLARQLRKAAGLRNIIVHEYVRLDLSLIYRIAKEDLTDFEALIFWPS